MMTLPSHHGEFLSPGLSNMQLKLYRRQIENHRLSEIVLPHHHMRGLSLRKSTAMVSREQLED